MEPYPSKHNQDPVTCHTGDTPVELHDWILPDTQRHVVRGVASKHNKQLDWSSWKHGCSRRFVQRCALKSAVVKTAGIAQQFLQNFASLTSVSICNSRVQRSTLSTNKFVVTRCGTGNVVHLNCVTHNAADIDEGIPSIHCRYLQAPSAVREYHDHPDHEEIFGSAR